MCVSWLDPNSNKPTVKGHLETPGKPRTQTGF